MVKSMPNEPYFLKTERLGFRWWAKQDLAAARELWGDIEVTRFFGGPFSDEEIGQRLGREISRMDTHRLPAGGCDSRIGISSAAKVLGPRAGSGSCPRSDCLCVWNDWSEEFVCGTSS